MTKVLVVTQYFYPENFRINEAVDLMINQGWDVEVLTSYPSYPNRYKFQSWQKSQKFSQNNISVCRLNSWRRTSGSKLDIAMHYLCFLWVVPFIPIIFFKKKFDIVFCYQPSPVTVGIVSMVIAKWLGSTSVIWVQDLWPDSLGKYLGHHKSCLYKFAMVISKAIYRQHKYILCQSSGMTKILSDRLPNNKIYFLPNFAESQYDLEIKNKKFPRKMNIFFTGNIGESQDFRTVLQAIEICSKKTDYFHLTIVGDGRNKKWLAKEIHDRGLLSFVTIKDSCSIDEVIKYYEEADVMLLCLQSTSAFKITIPGKFQSYLFAGKPVIGAISGEVNELINFNKLGMAAEAGDFQGLADIFIKIINMDFETHLEMSNRCKEFYIKNYDSQKFMDRLCTVLEK